MTRTPVSIAYFMAVTLAAISAQPQFQFQQYPTGYQEQQQLQQQPQQQYLVPQQQPQQQFFVRAQQQPQQQPQQFEPQPEKVTGYNPEDVIPAVVSPLKNLDKAQSNGNYVDFINQLYRFDRTKPALQKYRRSVSLDPVLAEEDATTSTHSRQKRAIIFRPMFVYRQQKVRKEKIKEERAEAAKAAAERQSVSANQGQLYKDKQNNVYREYNSFYEPYRYGQRFPYRNY